MSDRHAYPSRCSLEYSRELTKLHFRQQGMTNHEIREVMVGLFLRLDADDRVDHIRELQHYHFDLDSRPSELAQLIVSSGREHGR